MMRAWLVLLAAWGAYGQTCAHQVFKAPVGAVLVFRNGTLVRQGPDYAYVKTAGQLPTVNPLTYAAGDSFSVVFSRSVPLTLTVAGTTVTYYSYQTWQETWDCAGSSGASKLDALEQCSGAGTVAGTNPPVTYDCAGLLRATITKADGSKLIITGVTGIGPGGTWTPVQ